MTEDTAVMVEHLTKESKILPKDFCNIKNKVRDQQNLSRNNVIEFHTFQQ